MRGADVPILGHAWYKSPAGPPRPAVVEIPQDDALHWDVMNGIKGGRYGTGRA
jgi:hypothetical protein